MRLYGTRATADACAARQRTAAVPRGRDPMSVRQAAGARGRPARGPAIPSGLPLCKLHPPATQRRIKNWIRERNLNADNRSPQSRRPRTDALFRRYSVVCHERIACRSPRAAPRATRRDRFRALSRARQRFARCMPVCRRYMRQGEHADTDVARTIMTRVPNRGPSSMPAPGAARMYVYLAATQIGWLVCVMTAASHHAAWGVRRAAECCARVRRAFERPVENYVNHDITKARLASCKQR